MTPLLVIVAPVAADMLPHAPLPGIGVSVTQLVVAFVCAVLLTRSAFFLALRSGLLRLRVAFHNQCRSCMAMRYQSGIDGGITGRNACFYDPYEDDEHNHGIIRIQQDELNETVRKCHDAGLRCCVHAIGDRAFDMALDAYENAIEKSPRKDHRHRIEHMGNWLATQERMQRMVRSGLIAIPVVVWATRRFDKVLAELKSCFHILADAGTHLGGVHFELTGENVTECVGGASGVTEADLARAYRSQVDPRLNYEQALEMALLLARLMSGQRR